MSIAKNLKRLSTVLSRPSLLRTNSKYIFLLSHMRSRSSLLSHILGSNDQICGYSELHNSYTKRSSLIKMHVDIYRDLECSFANNYIFDKLLHNSRILSDDVINYTNAKLIILLREPESTLKSIVNMGDLLKKDKYQNQNLAFEYYCNRVKVLSEYAKSNYDVFYVDSEELVKNPNSVLARVSSWLELDQSLSQQYSIFNRTGATRAGDPSRNILEGKIIQTSKHEGIDLDECLLSEATEIYNLCRDRFVKHAT